MNKVFLLLFLVFFQAIQVFGFSEKIDTKLEHIVQKLVNEGAIPGANIGIWVPQKGQWLGSFGVANKITKEALTLKHYFRIGSVSKTFVGTSILQLVDKEKLSLDDKISKYVKNVPNGDKITIRHLGNMTSGLPNYSEDKEFEAGIREVWTSESLLKFAFKNPVEFEPGEKFHYSNTNTVLLGLVIKKVSGLSVDKYIEKNIIKPLNLKNTFYPLNENMPFPYAHGYTKQTPNNEEEDSSMWNPSWTNAAGQMISTLEDLRIWTEALGTGKLLSKKSYEEMKKWGTVPPNTNERKYGFTIGYNYGWLYHTGELPGYNTVISYLPENGAVVVVMVNTDSHIKSKKEKIAPVIKIFSEVAKLLFPDHIPK